MTKPKYVAAALSSNLKFIIPVAVTLVILVVAMFVFIIPQFHSSIIERKKEMVQQEVLTAWSVLQYYYSQESSGELTRSEAQALSISQIREMRYGPEMKDYFWINDTIPVMIMHPYRTNLDGKNVADYTDPNGKHLFLAFKDIVLRQDEGYVDYMWQWKDDSSHIVPKVSYVKGFSPWGWIIGTGIYMKDVHAEIALISKDIISVILGTLAIFLLISIYVILQGAKTELARQKADEAFKEGAEQYRCLSEHNTDFIMRYDREGRHLYMNKAALKLIGKPLSEVINLTPREMGFESGMCDTWETAIQQVFDTGTPQQASFEFESGDSQKLILDWRVVPEFTEDGHVYAALGVSRDITDTCLAKNRLDAMNQRLKLTNKELITKRRELEEFLHTVSHDLKAPIISIQGFSQLLKKRMADRVGDTSLNYINRISANCHTIESLLNDLLELSRIGRLDEPFERINFEKMIYEVIADFSIVTVDNNIEIKYYPSVPDILGRPDRIRQVLVNLIDNAVKYMPAKDNALIEIGCVEAEGDTDVSYAGLYIRDNGDGISQKQIGNIFNMFQRAREQDDITQGTGAGLAIVKKIVTNHGGKVWVKSKPGLSTEFCFTLPIAGQKKLGDNTVDRIKAPLIIKPVPEMSYD
ncbi:MAG: cache domain-containing protein [candidate division Zixibacteria bacterium]|nr:cache domain-containing protein [candidate division Zixibacteria bacterium]